MTEETAEINVHIVQSMIESLDNFGDHLEVYLEDANGNLRYAGDAVTRTLPRLGTVVVIQDDGKVEDDRQV